MIRKRILVVDDSSVIRRFLVNLFKKNGYEVESAKNGLEALKKLKESRFSLVTLDIEMPVMDGITALKEIMKEVPTRVVILSSFTKESAGVTFEALEIGALDYIEKPQSSVDIARVSEKIMQKVKEVLLMPRRGIQKSFTPSLHVTTPTLGNLSMGFVLIGASTGGPRLIEHICKSLPENYPHAVCVVQHMPTDFTAGFAKRLNTLSKVEVLEAENGLILQSGRVIIAKGGGHLHFRKKLKEYGVLLAPNTRERFFTPSIDEMFLSANELLPIAKTMAVELTGIGDDGADGMVLLRKSGVYTLAESEKTAVVYGMPKEAALRGGASKVLDFNDIVDEIMRYGQNGKFKH